MRVCLRERDGDGKWKKGRNREQDRHGSVPGGASQHEADSVAEAAGDKSQRQSTEVAGAIRAAATGLGGWQTVSPQQLYGMQGQSGGQGRGKKEG